MRIRSLLQTSDNHRHVLLLIIFRHKCNQSLRTSTSHGPGHLHATRPRSRCVLHGARMLCVSQGIPYTWNCPYSGVPVSCASRVLERVGAIGAKTAACLASAAVVRYSQAPRPQVRLATWGKNEDDRSGRGPGGMRSSLQSSACPRIRVLDPFPHTAMASTSPAFIGPCKVCYAAQSLVH